MEIDIIGAGFAGLITAKVFEHHDVTIYEKQKTIPNNHNAILRFKTNDIGKLLNKDFKKVFVSKGIFENSDVSCSIRQNNLYSKKVTGLISDRSILDAVKNIKYERFICDFNLQEYLSINCDIKYNFDYEVRVTADAHVPIISTIPMPNLMNMLGYENKPKFSYSRIFVEQYKFKNCNTYQTIYFTGEIPLYRASITGNIFILEYNQFCDGDETFKNTELALKAFGIPNSFIKKKILTLNLNGQQYGKLDPIDDFERKTFTGWATKKYNIYSIGRFATWRNIKLDDVVKDAFKIKKAIENNGYFQ